MDIAAIQDGLTFISKVSGVRQTYHVFEARDYYFVLSFSRSKTKNGSGYFNVVDKKAIQYVQSRFSGYQDVTANDVKEKAKRTKHAPSSLDALNALYVLVALEQAEITGEGAHQQLFFEIY